MNIETPQTDIEAFLINDFNINIYNELADGFVYQDLFKPLDFFNHLYSEFNFFQTNALKYLTIKNHFKPYSHFHYIEMSIEPRFVNTVVNNDQRVFFLENFVELLNVFNEVDNEIVQNSYQYIIQLYELAHSETLINIKKEPNKFDFSETKKALSKIENNKEKINYLIEQRTDFKQCDDNWASDWGLVSFDKKCDLEIKKLKELLELEPQQSTAPTISNSLKWHGTQTAFIELVQALILNKTITAKSNKEIITTLSNVFNFKVTNPDKTFNDIKDTRNNGAETLFLNELKDTLYNHIQQVKQKKNR